MSTFEQYYDQNPIAVVDQNSWDMRTPEVALQFRAQSVYTPLVEWTDQPARTGAATNIVTELLEGDVNTNEIPFTANYITATGLDSRQRSYGVARYGDKVQLHESENIFNQWIMNGKRDWKPLLRSVLGTNILRKFEMLARNAHLLGPKEFWTYAGNGTSFATLSGDDTFGLGIINEWQLRLGATGSPVVPGDAAAAKVAIVPPGVIYDFFKSLGAASSSEASMWRDADIQAGKKLNYELGSYKGVRFVQAPNDRFGMNPAVLYNCGVIGKQYGVTAPIKIGDGAPDPSSTKVHSVWGVGQKNATHYLQLEDLTTSDFAVNDVVSIHVAQSAAYGVTGGCDPMDGTKIERRVVSMDASTNRLVLDRPILADYNVPFVGTSITGASPTTMYAFVTKAKHIGFVLVLGARGGVLGAVARALKFYEPKPIDDFESTWRFVWDLHAGYNIWEPNFFECHFCNVSLAKPGGIIAP